VRGPLLISGYRRGPRDLRLVAGLLMRPKPHTAPRPPSAPRAKCSEQPLRVLRTDSAGSPFRWALGPPELPRPHGQLAFPTIRPGCTQSTLRLSQGAPPGLPGSPLRLLGARRRLNAGASRVNSPKGLVARRYRRSEGLFFLSHIPRCQATDAGVRPGSSSA
jgi:hypothetical protein